MSAAERREAAGTMIGHWPYRFCALCGKQIHWVKTKKNGKQMPVDLDLVRGDGEKRMVLHDGSVVVKAGPEFLGYEPHFGTCPVYKERSKSNKTTIKRNKR